jgi:hypothetical protein
MLKIEMRFGGSPSRTQKPASDFAHA